MGTATVAEYCEGKLRLKTGKKYICVIGHQAGDRRRRHQWFCWEGPGQRVIGVFFPHPLFAATVVAHVRRLRRSEFSLPPPFSSLLFPCLVFATLIPAHVMALSRRKRRRGGGGGGGVSTRSENRGETLLTHYRGEEGERGQKFCCYSDFSYSPSPCLAASDKCT